MTTIARPLTAINAAGAVARSVWAWEAHAMTEKQIAVMVMVPVVVGTGIALWRQGAMGGKALAVAALSTVAVGAFIVLMQ
ncbi:hypothetical protein [Magnetospirillum aberrantis]|uniref:Uncharacterized protein n=1 Tax=Magnetospirillum aberrantis SpK TaxID=908842 RepID=A0A7C9QRS9_9PROT|nr:hypothetical protein [Magnetospirillum aberrantis]NFV79060.1 hypothetical protein [Magnetospirillum aberrantis SpK]